MYDHDIDTFIIVAETGSFSAASRKLYISKPAVTQQINLLENKLNCKLFCRDSHGVYLTEAGKLFLVQAKKIKELCLTTKQMIQTYQNTLTVGTGYLSTTNLLDKYWSNFSKNKNVKLEFQEIKDCEQIPENIDLIESVYSQEPMPKQDFLFKRVTTTPLMVGVPPESTLAKKDSLTLTDLDNQKIWIIKSNVLRQSRQIRKLIQDNCQNTCFVQYSVYNKAQINAALIANNLILIHESLASSCAPFIIKSIDWDFDADVGFFYRSQASNITHQFLSEI